MKNVYSRIVGRLSLICPSVREVPDEATTFSIPDWCIDITSRYPSTMMHLSVLPMERYFSENEVDIIAFMARVLLSSVDVSDPTARAKVINVILETVACVDEPVKRQEYLTECSRHFSPAAIDTIPA